MKKKKIVFFTASMGRGGAERVISILSDYLAQNGWDVTIGMLLHNIRDGYTLNENVKVKTFFPENGSKLKKIIADVKNVHRYVKSENPDVVVSFMSVNIVISRIALSGINVKFIGSERIDPAMAGRNFIFRKFVEGAYSKADRMIFQTERAKSYFNKKIQNKGIVIGNPIEVACEAIEEKKNKIVSVGRLVPQKNQMMLIDVFQNILRKYPQYTLEILGEGPERRKLETRIKELGLEENVFLPGSKKNLHEYIKDAQLFVLPSNYEGLSNALLEAMLMGLPCISTDCAGSDEVIVNGENGLLVPVGNEEELTRAIMNLMEDVELREKLAMNGKKSVERFKTRNIINQWMEVIS